SAVGTAARPLRAELLAWPPTTEKRGELLALPRGRRAAACALFGVQRGGDRGNPKARLCGRDRAERGAVRGPPGQRHPRPSRGRTRSLDQSRLGAGVGGQGTSALGSARLRDARGYQIRLGGDVLAPPSFAQPTAKCAFARGSGAPARGDGAQSARAEVSSPSGPYWPRLRRWLRPPRTLKITRSGQVYLLLTLGVGLGALNTGNNLLFLLVAL